MKELTTKEIQAILEEDKYGYDLPYGENFVLVGESGRIEVSPTMYLWIISDVKLEKSFILDLSRKYSEAIFKVLEVLKKVENAESRKLLADEKMMVFTKVYQLMATTTDVKETIDNVLTFTDEELCAAFFLYNECGFYRKWLKEHK